MRTLTEADKRHLLACANERWRLALEACRDPATFGTQHKLDLLDLLDGSVEAALCWSIAIWPNWKGIRPQLYPADCY